MLMHHDTHIQSVMKISSFAVSSASATPAMYVAPSTNHLTGASSRRGANDSKGLTLVMSAVYFSIAALISSAHRAAFFALRHFSVSFLKEYL